MAKNTVTDWDENPNLNTDIGGTNIDEGCAPSGMNNAVRTVMSQVRTFFRSSLFRLRDSTDQTKLLAFDLSGLSSGTQTLTAPNASGVIALAGSPDNKVADYTVVVADAGKVIYVNASGAN